MPSPSQRLTARRLVTSLLAAGSAGASLLLLSCADQTGPGEPVPGRFSLAPRFESNVAGIVPLAHARFTLTRVPEGTVATDTVIDIAAGQDTLDVAIVVPMMHATETFSMRIALVSPAGDTVFRAGPQEVQPVATGSVPQVAVTLLYTGIGADAMRVVCLYDSVRVFAGDATLLAAVARDSSDNPIPGTPVGWRSLDSAIARVPDPASGSVAGVAPGTARIVAELLTGQADTALVIVSLPPANVLADSGNGQTGVTGAQLPTALVARVVASDGAGVPDQWVRFVAASGGGVLSVDSSLTDGAGRARTLWTLGPVAGTQIVQATTPRLPGVTATFTATSTAGTVGGIAIVAGDGQSGLVGSTLPIAPSVRITDAQSNPVPGVPVLFAVSGGGGAVSPGTPVQTDGNGIASADAWVLGPAVGINTLTVTADTLTPVLFTATATGSGGAMSMVLNGGNGQTGLAGTPLLLPASVLVRDTANNVVVGVAVGFAATLGGGSVGNPAPLTDGSGIAAVFWTLGAPGTNELTASLAGLPDVVFQATGTVGAPDTVVIVSGNTQTDTAGLPLAQPLVVEVRDSVGNPVSGIAVNWNTFNGSISPPTNSTDLSGRAQATWTLGTNAVTQLATAAVSGLTPAVFTATAVFPNPTVLLALAGTDRVRLTDSATLNVSLSAPAPVGGTLVTLSVDNRAVLGLDTTEVFIPETGTTTQTRVYGLSSGSTVVRGNASGYTEGATPILVTVQVLSMPTTLNVPYGGTASLPLQISSPAPAGGVAVTVVSGNPAAVGVQSPTVTIPEGQQTANAILTGTTPGPATITASTTDFGVAQTSAATTANLNVIESGATISQTIGDTLTVRLESSGAPIAAPSPGIAVTFTARNPACLAATSPVTIPTGLVSTTTLISYGGSAATPCNTYLVAEAAGINPDSLSVTVNPPPGITVYQYTLGAGLNRYADGYLGVTNHGGVDVVIKSTNPVLLRIAPDANTVGGDSIVRFLPNGQNYFTYYVQALEGVVDTAGASAPVTVRAQGFLDGAQSHIVRPLSFQVENVPASTTTLSDSAPFYVQVGYRPPNYPYLYEAQSIRPGGQPLTITLVNDTLAVGDLVKSGGVRGDTLTVQIPVGTYYSPTTVAAGGIAFDPINAGTTTITGFAAGAMPTTYAVRAITVSAPGITVYQYTLGAGLHRYADGYLGATNHGGVDVVIKSTNPALLRIAPDANTVGGDSIVRFVANGQNYFTYYIQALEGVVDTAGVSAPVTVRAQGFLDGAQSHIVRPLSFQVENVPGSLTTLSDSAPFYVQVGYRPPNYPYLYEAQSIRPGGQPVTITMVNDSLAVGDLVQSGGVRGDTLTVQIPVGAYYSPTTVAGGGIAFDPMNAGTTTLTGLAPGALPTTYATRVVTVSAPGITIYQYNVGTGLQRSADGYLGATNHGGVTVVVRSSDPGALLLSPNSTTVGADTVAIFVPNGANYFSYYIQGLEGVADTGVVTVPITVTAPGFTGASQSHLVRRPAFDIYNLPGSTTTLSDSVPLYVQIGYTLPGYGYLYEVQTLRAGAPGLTVTLAVGTPGVGRLITTALTADTVTVQIPAGSYYSPTSVVSGGAAFDPLTAGSTTVFGIVPGYDQAGLRSVTVSAPGITLYESTVGAGLQKSTYGYLGASNHGGVNVEITSSAPGVALLSPDANTPGTGSLTVFVPDGQNYFYYYAQGVEGQTGTATVTARATGFTDGSTPLTVVAPGIGLYGIPPTLSASADSVAFYAQVGVPYADNQYIYDVQSVRAGGTPLTVTFTHSAAAVADLITETLGRKETVTVTIPIGTYYSPTSVIQGGAAIKGTAAGTTVVTGSVPGFITLLVDGQRTVTVTP